MPQLDKVTFLSQFFWLFAFFSIFYIFSLKSFLPSISRILKFRRKRLASINQESRFGDDKREIDLSTEDSKIRGTAEKFFENTIKSYREIFKQNKLKTGKWLDDYTNTVNKEHLVKGNRLYLKSIGEQSLSNSLGIESFGNKFAEKVFYARLNKRYITLLLKPIYKRVKGTRLENSFKKKR